MAKMGKVHFLTSFMEFLLDEGIRAEDTYLSDASRFLRFLLQRAGPADVEAFLATCGPSPSTRERVRRSLRTFYRFAVRHLDLPRCPITVEGPPSKTKKHLPLSSQAGAGRGAGI